MNNPSATTTQPVRHYEYGIIPPGSVYRAKWIGDDGKVHVGLPCSLESAREERDAKAKEGREAWISSE